jgi:hypothetical protein
MSESTPYNALLGENGYTKKRRVRWWLIFSIFAVPISLILATVFVFRVGFTIREIQGREAMKVELRKLNEDGISIDDHELMKCYRGRTSQEQTESWSKVFESLNSPEFSTSSSGIPVIDRSVALNPFADEFDTSSDWEFLEKCIRFTDEQSELIQTIRSLALAPEPCYFPVAFQSTQTRLPESQNLRMAAWLLRLDAQVAIHRREQSRAFDDIVALFELSKHLDAMPFLVSKLVGNAVRRMALQSLQSAIRIDLLPYEQLLEIDRIVDRNCDIDDRWRTLMLDELSVSLPNFVDPNRTMQTKTAIPARGHDAVYFIRLMRSATSVATNDWPILYRSSIELDSKLMKDAGSSLKRIDLILSGLLVPAFSSVAAVMINDAQLHRQARLAIALRLHQHQQGSLPQTLDELPNTVAKLTPYGEKPFAYSLQDGRAVIWGFWLSRTQQQTPIEIPDTAQPIAVTLDNRAIVWWLDE